MSASIIRSREEINLPKTSCSTDIHVLSLDLDLYGSSEPSTSNDVAVGGEMLLPRSDITQHGYAAYQDVGI